jgi:carnitine 3-dehydrogenase
LTTHRVAVVGAGLTGASWAGLFAAHGLAVRLVDRDADTLARGLDRAAQAARFLVREGLACPDEAERGVAGLQGEESVGRAAEGAYLVQEAVTEDLEAKRAVFRQAGEAAPHALVCTSSSGLSITAIQAGMPDPSRSLAAHPYNPPHLVPLVEIAPGAATSRQALERAAAFYRAVGKEPVTLRADVPGYIGNRLAAALWREAIDLVRRGVATVDEVDRAVRLGPGFRWAVLGPHLTYDLGGGEQGIAGHLDHLAGIKEGILRDLAGWTAFPADTARLLEAGLEAERAAPPYAGSPTQAEIAELRDRSFAAVARALKQTGAIES